MPRLTKRLRHFLRDRLAPSAAARFVRLYVRTLRLEWRGFDQVQAWRARGPVILCHWHGDDLALLGAFRDQGLTMMVSRSRDGELIAGVLEALGYATVRGSTSHYGVPALKDLVRLLRSGRDVGLTVDGPLGPRAVVKPGVAALAKLTGAPVFPVAVWASRRWLWAKTWHQTYLPKPGAVVRLQAGEPILVPARADKAELEGGRARIEAEFHRLRELVARGD
jgi:lysophospholipid acyltransferase (LPLAT)-like uncharacterized protein